MLTIILLGASGQLGQALQQDLTALGTVLTPTRQELDLTDLAAVKAWFAQQQVDVIINAAAMTDVDGAERNGALCEALNHQLPAALGAIAKEKHSWLCHFSTDYVFNGKKAAAYVETDETAPLQQYGRSKVAGEEAIVASGCRHLIFRTSWLYSSTGRNFLTTMLSLAPERQEPFLVVDDQTGAPTSAIDLADAVVSIFSKIFAMSQEEARAVSGIYHLTAAGECSWYEFATTIFHYAVDEDLLEQQPEVLPTDSQSLNRAAKRPANSRLCNDKVNTTFGISMSPWQQQLTECLQLIKKHTETGK
ncbi:dTDP-4-dehydrorhamnose reductase [Rheinheimera sp.]|uniref:dTDP-4-dehydrorhamnose reductase n=1 Tax=Rheinheimera sp. TaxID=1869214 RepID=UPI0027BA1D7C|nr:dTDP-4-dehydrorhamnose reductase [Rheinheimera sp.]